MTGQGSTGVGYIYIMPPFTSSCSGRVVGYWFCYRNTSSTTGGRVRIATVLLLEERGQDYRVVANFTVAALSDDSCLPGRFQPVGGCCVVRNLTTQDLHVIPEYLYGVVDLSDGGPDMIRTHDSTGYGYDFVSGIYTMNSQMIMRSDLQNAKNQTVKMFQFIIGEFRINLKFVNP